MTQTVLVFGASGMLGSRIAHHLLDAPDAAVRMMVRKGSSRDAVTPLTSRGAEVVEGDLSDPDSLSRAALGVDVIVSAVQGGADVIVDGQLALLDSALAQGVRRILPSDYALDLFKSPTGEHANFDMRRQADKAIAASGIEHVHILNGAFMDNFLNSQFGGVFDRDRRVASYWGTGEEHFDATSVEDTARYTARAALDRDLPSGKFAVAGEQLSFGAIVSAVETVSGERFERRSKGSEADLRAEIARLRAVDSASFKALGDTYLLYMIDGQTRLDDLQNARYPDIRPESYVEHVRKHWKGH